MTSDPECFDACSADEVAMLVWVVGACWLWKVEPLCFFCLFIFFGGKVSPGSITRYKVGCYNQYKKKNSRKMQPKDLQDHVGQDWKLLFFFS